MNDWQQKQVKFDQLPVDVDAINRTSVALNKTAATLNSNVTSVEADINVLVMLVSRIRNTRLQLWNKGFPTPAMPFLMT